MPNPTFPTLTVNPALPIGMKLDDPTIRADAEGGWTATRPRYTSFRREWDVRYPYMPAADYATLEAFYRDTVVAGALIFDWVDEAGTTRHVRFNSQLEAPLIMPGVYEVHFTLREA